MNEALEVTVSQDPPIRETADEAQIVPPTDPDAEAVLAAHLASTALPEGFDPAVHAVDATGHPKTRRDGSFALKRGRKPGAVGQPVSATDNGDPPKDPAPTINTKEAARQAFALVTGVATQFIGDEWAPADRAEEKFMVDSIDAYFVARGGAPDLGPGWGLLAACVVYSMRRSNKPNTRDKIGYAWNKARSVVTGWFKRGT